MIAIPHFISPEEYLSIERRSPIRHEYQRGLVYAMAGGSDNHDRIAFNLLKLIDNHLGDRTDCRFHSGNVKVNYEAEFYYYPDVFVTCDPRDRQDRYIKRYPKLIVEVLSPGTEAFDREGKFNDYAKLDSLEEYVLISQTEPQVECRRRTPAGDWQTVIYQLGDSVGSSLGDRVTLSSINLASINLEFPITALYRGLDD